MTEREKFLRKFNEAFVNNDINFIIDSVEENITWTMVGEETVIGKEEVAKLMNKMEGPSELDLKINSIIAQGNTAAVDGTMNMTDKEGKRKSYGFCDVYKFSGSKEQKILELKAYVIEIKANPVK